MGRFTTRTRRLTTDGPEAGGELSPELRAALPPRFEAVGESLASGSVSVAACEVVGASLARDGLTLAESLDALASTSRLVRGTDPQLEAAALTMVSLHLGLVMESRDLLAQWRGARMAG